MHVVWLSLNPDAPPRGYWDQAFLERFFSGQLWNPPGFPEFIHHEALDGLESAVVVLPGGAHQELITEVNLALESLESCHLIITSDEGSFFPWRDLKHPNLKVWIQTPRSDRHEGIDGSVPVGYPTGFCEGLDALSGEKSLDVFFAGQATNPHRQAWLKQLRHRRHGSFVLETPGFTQGMSLGEYREKMNAAKIAPCPGGILTPDSFRLWEALEAGCVPIVGTKAGEWDVPPFWEFLLGDVPFRLVSNPEELNQVIDEELAAWPMNTIKLGAWWKGFQRAFSYRFLEQLGYEIPGGALTVVIPTSPIESHPDTSVLEATIASIRERLPDAEILLAADGVRPEQEHLRIQYQDYLRRVVWLCARRWRNVLPVISETWQHQANITRDALKLVTTPYLLFCEHDTPLTGEIPFEDLIRRLAHFAVIRLHHEASILPEHKYLMLKMTSRNKIPIRQTIQWSQRPHIAKTDFYRQILEQYFSPDSRTMIEDLMHGIVQDDYQGNGWGRFRIGIYAPKGDIKRSLHLDARGSEPKFEMDFGTCV